MDLNAIQDLMLLMEGPAFVLEEGRLALVNQEAEALGLRAGCSLWELPEVMAAPTPGETIPERDLFLNGKHWTLRSAVLERWTLCRLQPERPLIPPANDNTLLHTAGSIRQAVQDLTTALDGLVDTGAAQDPEAAHSASLALRSVYRLRRTAGDLELFVRLRSGGYQLTPELCELGSRTEDLCGEMAELLRSAGILLRWKLPAVPLRVCLDWRLIAALLRELITNAALQTADHAVFLELQGVSSGKLSFLVKNRAANAIPETPFHRHSADHTDLRPGLGMGLSLVAAGAAFHGGSLLLSAEDSGQVTAILSVALSDPPLPGTKRSEIQLPLDPDLSLIALSPALPPEAYRPDELL